MPLKMLYLDIQSKQQQISYRVSLGVVKIRQNEALEICSENSSFFQPVDAFNRISKSNCCCQINARLLDPACYLT